MPFKLTTVYARIRNQLDFLSWERILPSSLSRLIPMVLRSGQSHPDQSLRFIDFSIRGNRISHAMAKDISLQGEML